MDHRPSEENAPSRDDRSLQAGTTVRRQTRASVISETWYLDPKEWKKLHQEILFAKASFRRMTRMVKMQEIRLLQGPTIRWHQKQRCVKMKAALDNKTADILSLLQRNPKGSVLQRELRRWRLDYARYVQDRDKLEQILKADHDKRRREHQEDASLARMRHLKQEIADYQKIVQRLARREKLLMQAIQAGVYMTGPEMKQLGDLGGSSFLAKIKGHEST